LPHPECAARKNGFGQVILNVMKKKPEAKINRSTVGLCVDCTNARRVQTNRGSVFVLCDLSRNDPQFAKYPRLPVLACAGHCSQTSP